MSSTTPKFVRQEAHDNSLLLKFLKDYKLEHLYKTLSKSRINIAELCELDEEILRQTASYRLKLKGNDLSQFTKSLKTYHNLQLLSKRNLEISSCIDNLEFTKNELTIKQRNDVVYVQEKFKKIMRTLKKRENILIREISKKSENKINLLNEQILHLNKYKTKLEHQYHIINIENDQKTHEEEVNIETESDEENIDSSINVATNMLLNEQVQYDKARFNNINAMSVEIPNYDDIITQIKRTGIVIDEFYIDEDPPFDNKIDDKLDCLCGTQLILTKVKEAYNPQKHKIYCNFCTNFCHFNTDIYHCPLGDVKLHPGGFDLCYFCGSKCFEARLADKRREKEEHRKKQRKRNAKSNVLDSVRVNKTYRRKRPNAPKNNKSTKPMISKFRHHRSYSEMKSNQWEQKLNDNFEYNQPLKQLIDMGYDYKKSKKLIIKYKGNITKAMGELMM